MPFFCQLIEENTDKVAALMSFNMLASHVDEVNRPTPKWPSTHPTTYQTDSMPETGVEGSDSYGGELKKIIGRLPFCRKTTAALTNTLLSLTNTLLSSGTLQAIALAGRSNSMASMAGVVGVARVHKKFTQNMANALSQRAMEAFTKTLMRNEGATPKP